MEKWKWRLHSGSSLSSVVMLTFIRTGSSNSEELQQLQCLKYAAMCVAVSTSRHFNKAKLFLVILTLSALSHQSTPWRPSFPRGPGTQRPSAQVPPRSIWAPVFCSSHTRGRRTRGTEENGTNIKHSYINLLQETNTCGFFTIPPGCLAHALMQIDAFTAFTALLVNIGCFNGAVEITF